MTTKSTLVLTVLIAIASICLQKANAQANTKLSNLAAPTAVNQNLVPGSDSVKNLGTAVKNWGIGYLYQLKLRKNQANNGSVLDGNGIELGFGVTGKEVNAGKIGYAMFTPNTLDIVGAGNTSSTRAIKFFAEAGSTFRGNINVSYHSTVTVPHLSLNETQSDYARLNFTNTATANYFAIAGLPQATTADARLNVYYSATGDVFVIRGDGKVGIGTNTPATLLHVTSQTELISVYGVTNGANGTGVLGEANNGTLAYGIWGKSTSGYAGFFNGKLGYTGSLVQVSDQRLKENIKPLDNVMDKIMLLKPSKYNFKKEYSKMNLPQGEQVGFIAQDMEKIFPQLINTIADKQSDNKKASEYKGINYVALIPLLTKAIQEQQEEITELKRDLKRLSGDAALSENVSAAKTAVVSDAILSQNVPNPFSTSSTIQYNLPAHFKSAQLVITGANGTVVKQVQLNAGKGTVNVNAYSLSSGAYTYSLVVDGSTTESKKMIVGK